MSWRGRRIGEERDQSFGERSRKEALRISLTNEIRERCFLIEANADGGGQLVAHDLDGLLTVTLCLHSGLNMVLNSSRQTGSLAGRQAGRQTYRLTD